MRKKRIISFVLILVLLLTVPVFAASQYGSVWVGKYKSSKRSFRAYIDYKWEPTYTDTEARLTIKGFGIQCLDKTKKFRLPAKSVKKASVAVNLKPVSGKKKITKKTKSKLKFPAAEKNAKAKLGSVTWIFKRTTKARSLKVTYKASKGKQQGKAWKKYRNAWRGSSKGTLKLTIPPAPDYVYNGLSFNLPSSSRGKTATASVSKKNGRTYTYKIFKQAAGYSEYSSYLSDRGCSVCALTTILNTMKGLSLTPDKTLNIIKKIDEKAFEENFSKKASKQMPIALNGITKVLDSYGVKYKRGTNDIKEVSDWLNAGRPVIMTIGDGSAGGLSSVTHTLLLLGLDQKGYVVIGDSALKSASIWGKDGLIKHGRLRLEDMMSYIKTDSWNVSNGNFFYKNTIDRGYILVGP